MAEGKTVQSVAKAMKLLELLNETGSAMSLSEISQQTGWPKSTIHGILSTMREDSLVAQDKEGRYMLGIRLFEYGCAFRASWKTLDVIRPYIDHISYETGEAVFLSIMDQGAVVTLDRADDRSGLWIRPDLGCRLPVHCTAEGKLFLAYMGEAKREAILNAYEYTAFTEHTITDKRSLLKELAQIREKGYALENSEFKTGLRAIAAPVLDAAGEVHYAVGIIGMFRQIESESFGKASSVVITTAKEISKKIFDTAAEH